jgi:hypothetical protein
VFVLVALFGIWLHSQLRWVEKRHDWLAAQHAVLVRAGESLEDYQKRHPHRWKYILESRLSNGTRRFSKWRPLPTEPAWCFARCVLWMMRERPKASVLVGFVEDDPQRWSTLMESGRIREAVRHAQKLFPEAEIHWTACYTGPDRFH